jgi:hypothetical protein
VLPETFTKPRREFCDYFPNLRNQELHTSELPFESLSETKWLARCYDVSKVLCEHLGKGLADIDELHVAEIEPHFEYNELTELHDYHEADFGPEYDNM